MVVNSSSLVVPVITHPFSLSKGRIPVGSTPDVESPVAPHGLLEDSFSVLVPVPLFRPAKTSPRPAECYTGITLPPVLLQIARHVYFSLCRPGAVLLLMHAWSQHLG